jgi:hypothetical protein
MPSPELIATATVEPPQAVKDALSVRYTEIDKEALAVAAAAGIEAAHEAVGPDYSVMTMEEMGLWVSILESRLGIVEMKLGWMNDHPGYSFRRG